MNDAFLQVENLETAYGASQVLFGISLDIRAGEVLGLVGESGSGKSVTALSVLRLIPTPPGRIVGGEIQFMFGNPATVLPQTFGVGCIRVLINWL